MFDTAIIGTGPAGISAALTLRSLKKNFVWFGSRKLSEKIRVAEKIRNYPGLIQVSGEEMQQAFSRQLEDAGIEITEKTVTGVYPMGDYFAILCDQEAFEAKTVILCTGVAAVKPIPGELEFVGRGVSYCATCDGALYKGKTILVECTTKELEHEVEFLASLAEKVYLVPLYKNVQISSGNVELLREKPQAILGEWKVRQVVFDGRSVDVDGVFMLKDAVVPSVLVQGIEAPEGHVAVDRACRTNIPGCFAAGDCTGRPYQYVKAAGEGNVAAHSAAAFLAQTP